MADKIFFKCMKCGQTSWFIVDLENYVVVAERDLVCDDCNPVEED